jgi:hypothetical protein
MTRKRDGKTVGNRKIATVPMPVEIIDASVATAQPLTLASAKVNRSVTAADARKIKQTSQKAVPKTRADKKGLVLYLPPPVVVELRRLSLDTGKPVQTLGQMALNLLFTKYDRKTFEVSADSDAQA